MEGGAHYRAGNAGTCAGENPSQGLESPSPSKLVGKAGTDRQPGRCPQGTRQSKCRRLDWGLLAAQAGGTLGSFTLVCFLALGVKPRGFTLSYTASALF